MIRKIMLFISSYIPLYVLMILKNILERVTENGRFISKNIKNIQLFDEINDYALIILAVLSVASFLYLWMKIKDTVTEKYYIIQGVQDETSNYYFNYISIYLLSCMGLSLNSIVDSFVFAFLMLIVGYIYISNNMTYMNPTLNLMGYKVYNVTLESKSTKGKGDCLLIAKKSIKIKIGKEIQGSQNQDFVFVKQDFCEERR